MWKFSEDEEFDDEDDDMMTIVGTPTWKNKKKEHMCVCVWSVCVCEH